MIERTEELGLAARLPIVVGGRQVALRTLNLDESDEWLAKVGASVAAFDVPEQDPAELLGALGRQPTRIMFDLVTAYDVDGVLGPDLRQRFTKHELYAAVKQMVTAELPFVVDVHSVVEAFGPQLRAMLMPLLYRAVVQFQQESSTNGRLPNGDSTQPGSGDSSPRKGSSSSGRTAKTGSAASAKRQ